jgi:hypothetical protein
MGGNEPLAIVWRECATCRAYTAGDLTAEIMSEYQLHANWHVTQTGRVFSGASADT